MKSPFDGHGAEDRQLDFCDVEYKVDVPLLPDTTGAVYKDQPLADDVGQDEGAGSEVSCIAGSDEVVEAIRGRVIVSL